MIPNKCFSSCSLDTSSWIGHLFLTLDTSPIRRGWIYRKIIADLNDRAAELRREMWNLGQILDNIVNFILNLRIMLL